MNRLISILIWVAANLIFLTAGIVFDGHEKYYLILSYIGALQLLLALYLNGKNEKGLFNPLVLYIIVMYLFLFGQCLMWIFTDEYSGRNIIDIYSKALIVKAEIFTLYSFFFFHLALLATKTRTIKAVSENRIAQLKTAMFSFGKILVCLTIVPEIVYCVRSLIIAQNYGYLGIYEVETSAALQSFLNLREFFFPAVIMILCGDTKGSVVLRNFLIGVVSFDVFVCLYVGSRGDAMMQIISLLLVLQVVNTEKKERKVLMLIKYVLLFVVLIIVSNVVGAIRTLPDRSLSTFFDYLFSPDKERTDNMLVALVGELGASMATLMETIVLVPADYAHLHGTSYLYALTWLLPGFLTNNVWEKASMNNWIDSVKYTGSGWGFSTTAEAYFNFGFSGVLVFALIGFVVGKVFKGLNSSSYEKNPVEFALSFILFNRLLIFSRIDFLSTLPTIVYFYFGLKVFVYLIDYTMRKKGA